MQCSLHSLPMRPCLLASKAACRTGTGSSGRYHAFLGLNSSRCACSAAGSDSKQTSTWEQDLAEVLREPQADFERERADKPLQAWQLQKLQAAAATGRRKVKVNELAHELQLPRPHVLKFFKSYSPPLSRASNSLATEQSTDARADLSSATSSSDLDWDASDEDHSEVTRPGMQQGQAHTQAKAVPQSKLKKKTKPAAPFAERQRQGSDYEAKRLGRAVEATLERLYEESRRPSDQMLQGFFELHKGVPRRKVIDWFGERRRADQALSNRSRAKQSRDG